LTAKGQSPPEGALTFPFAEPALQLEVFDANELILGDLVPVKNQSSAIFVTQARTGRQFVLKHGISDTDVRGESLGWALSHVLGVKTPACALVREGKKQGWCSELVEGASSWRAIDATSCSAEDIANVFVLDALIGNTDRHEENVLVIDPGGADVYKVVSIDLANSWLGGGADGPLVRRVADVPETPQFLRGIDVAVIEEAAQAILRRAATLAKEPDKIGALLYAANSATKLDSLKNLQKIGEALTERLASIEDLLSQFLSATLLKRFP
jgi:hypothetical protein